MKICPNCGGARFATTRHVTQRVIVDSEENVVGIVSHTDEIIHDPDDKDLWVCEQCGYAGSGRSFNAGQNKRSGGLIASIKDAVKAFIDAMKLPDDEDLS